MIIGSESSHPATELLSGLRGNSRNKSTWSEAQIRDHLLTYQFPWVALYEDGELQSFVLYQIAGEVCEVHYLETLLAFRGRGCMRKLLNLFIIQQQGHLIWLDVHEGNSKALALYRSLGFQQTGLRRGYYRDGGTCFLMSRPSVGGL